MKIVNLMLLLSSIFSCTKNSSTPILDNIKFNSNVIDIKNLSVKVNEAASQNQQSVSMSKGNSTVISVKIIPKKTADDTINFFKFKKNEMKLLFAPSAVPYAGQITKDISCIQGVQIDYPSSDTATEMSQIFNLTATDRYIYGSCLPEQEIYRSQLLLLYCKKSAILYEIKFYFEKTKDYPAQVAHCI